MVNGINTVRDLRLFCPDLDSTTRLDEFCQVLSHLFNPWAPFVLLKMGATTWFIDLDGEPDQDLLQALLVRQDPPGVVLPDPASSARQIWGYRQHSDCYQLDVWLTHPSPLLLIEEQQLSLQHLVQVVSAELQDACSALRRICHCWITENLNMMDWLIQGPLMLSCENAQWQVRSLETGDVRSLPAEVVGWVHDMLSSDVANRQGRVWSRDQQLMQLRIVNLLDGQLLLFGQDLNLALRQRAIVQQQAFYQGALESGLTGLIAFNHQAQPVFINQKARDLLQVSEHDQGKQWCSHLHFYDLQEEIPELAELTGLFERYGVNKRCQCMVQYPDDTTRVLEFRWRISQDRRRHDISLYCLCTDITYEYQLRQTLHHIEHHLDHLLHYSPVVLYQQFNGSYHGFVYVSPNADRILGYESTQFMTQKELFVSRVHPDDRSLLETPTFAMEYRFWSEQEQSYIWLKDMREPDPDSDGGAYGALTNVTARKSSEEEKLRLIADLEEQKQLVTSTVNGLLDGVITIEQNGKILSNNPTVTKLLGYCSEELLGQNVSMLMPEPDAAAHNSYLQRYMAGGEARIVGIGRRVNARHKDGHLIPMHLSVTELPRGKDSLRRFVGCLHDLTELEQQQQALVQSSKLSAIGTLTSGIAHDFNNILGIMRGYAELLSTCGQPAVEKPALAIIKAADRASFMVKNLLEFSTNKQKENQLIEVSRLLQDITPMLKDACGGRIQLQVDLPSRPCWLELEKGGLENALLNLVINAKQAMEGAGEIHCRSAIEKPDSNWLGKQQAVAGDYLHIAVQDTGCGMSEQVKARIFEPFFSTKGAHGTGLGLAQVHGFITRCQGGLRVESAPGEGSSFSMYFPLMPALQQKGCLPVKNAETSATTVLVVDDEVELLELHATMLELAGFQVLTANNGHDALKILQDTPIDALITDVVMPGLNGLELANRARAIHPSLPIQLVSGFADESMVSGNFSQELYLQRLNKPVQTSKLVARIRQLTRMES